MSTGRQNECRLHNPKSDSQLDTFVQGTTKPAVPGMLPAFLLVSLFPVGPFVHMFLILFYWWMRKDDQECLGNTLWSRAETSSKETNHSVSKCTLRISGIFPHSTGDDV
jgi:hypothetical protein